MNIPVKKLIHPRIAIYIVILIIGGACSTQKNTFVNRNYHSITTKYNGYFNARESYRDGLYRLDQMHEDNYEDVLSVFRYGSTQQAASIAGNMDIAYQKASTAIRRHSMNIRGVEYNRWIDDSYFLIARSHYFKGDHNLAILTFQYVIRQFDSPLKYHSKIWVAKSHIKTGQYNNAQQILARVARNIEEGLLDEQGIYLFNKVYADYYLQQRNFAQAIPYLERSVQLAPGRKSRARLTFIQAQAYHQERNYPKAQQTYARVLKLNPDFEMAFQARINMAMAFDTESGDSKFIHSELTGMLRDSKNRDFRDQIYYALAQFSMRQRKEEQAIEYYNLALENYRGNASQKGVTFLRLGEISLKNKEYMEAARMYDSTMVYLSREYPEHEAAGKKNVLLRELAHNLRRIEREDSLQRLAAMSTADRNAILDIIIEEIAEQARLEQQMEQERAQLRQQMARSGRGQAPGAGDGGWYFYNPSAMSFGRNEFYAKWGERDLEDLWRISNKRTMAFGDMGDFDMEEGEEMDPSGRVTRASLMQNVPTTPEKKAASNDRMAHAHYNAAMIFKDRLIDLPSAIKYFEALITRFPETEHKLISYYFLYTLYAEAGNTVRADFYKNLIINDFPDTDFAMILSDPNYRENIMARQNRVKELYTRAYNAYISENYPLAMELVAQSQSDDIETTREQAARFSYLKALVLARSAERETLIEQLNYVTENFVDTEVHEPATNLLAFLGGGALVADPKTDASAKGDRRGERGGAGREKIDPQDAVFSFNPDAVHFYVLLINTQKMQIRQVRNEINNYNREKFAEKNLNMSTLFFDQNRQLITITNFPSAREALAYGTQMKASLQQKEYDANAYNGFAISVENYPLFYQDRKLDEYLDFFNRAYIDLE
ncbi:MAG: hypothetical protein EA361_10065 [Bacteroidetes bacterium]|nr:MAG: hypothetical protein EA361_10065 [Bacteroidota bacterium]